MELPKGLGGIGLRNVGLYNKAFLVKQAMRIHNAPSSLLHKVMYGAYKNSPIEAALTDSIPRQASCGFRGMCKSVQAAKEGFGKAIFRGNTRIMNERWLPSGKCNFKERRQNLTHQQEFVKDLFKPGTRRWDMHRVW